MNDALRVLLQPISLLGSTGSIGTQTLDICGEFSDKFEVVALAAGSNIELLSEQIKQFQPSLVAIQSSDKVAELQELIKDLPKQPEIMVGIEGQCAVAAHADAEAVVTGIVGCAGLKPTCAAIEAGKDICLANKETLIAGGPAVLPLAEKHGVHILPADSEHSALFQCIQGLPEGGLRRIILTASGGAFRDRPVETLKDVTVRNTLFQLAPSAGTADSIIPTAHTFWMRHPLMAARRRNERRTGAGGGRVLTPQLVDGAQDHGGLRHADEQRPRGDRGSLPVWHRL